MYLQMDKGHLLNEPSFFGMKQKKGADRMSPPFFTNESVLFYRRPALSRAFTEAL